MPSDLERLQQALLQFEDYDLADKAMALARESDNDGRKLLEQHITKKRWTGSGLEIELDNGRTFLLDDSSEFRRIQLVKE